VWYNGLQYGEGCGCAAKELKQEENVVCLSLFHLLPQPLALSIRALVAFFPLYI